MNYELNEEGNLTYLGIPLMETKAGVIGISPINNQKYTIEGMTLQELSSVIDNFLGYEEFAEVLNMVGSLGGGKWSDDPSGTTTTYEYDEDRKMLHVTEEK